MACPCGAARVSSTLVIATENAGKVSEFRELLAPLGVELLTAATAGVGVFPPETGETFTENAVAKARFAATASGFPAIADDSGLLVAALGDLPGVHSARFGGPGLDDAARTRLLLEKLAGETNRAAQFVSAIAYVHPNGAVHTFEGVVRGEITLEPRGERGFGYDPVFYVPELGGTFAEASLAAKDRVSHRGIAVRKFVQWLVDAGITPAR